MKINTTFELTDSQNTAIKETINALQADQSRHFIQGDVGSGKTLVALNVAKHFIEAGQQVVICAPTQTLAKQHYNTAIECITEIMIKYVDTNTPQQTVYGDLIIGTQAVLNRDYPNLGLMIIDEEHKFGINEKDHNCRTLLMSATPIPKTMHNSLTGNISTSIINTMPQGRKPIITKVVGQYKINILKDKLHEHLKSHQIYVVVNKISALHGLYEKYSKMATGRVVPLHSKSIDKDQIMADWQNGKIDILISTTVIEVGTNNPNATLIIIEEADKFGLAQLHQLRGRVCRGNFQGECLMIPSAYCTMQSLERMRSLESENNGLILSKFDLEMRGSGGSDITKQSGVQT